MIVKAKIPVKSYIELDVETDNPANVIQTAMNKTFDNDSRLKLASEILKNAVIDYTNITTQG